MGVDLILRKLGVPTDARLFFAPYCECKGNNLVFRCGNNEPELFGPDGHRVPRAECYWRAGNEFGRQVVICSSAMEAIAFLSLNEHRFNLDDLLFISVGPCPLRELLKGRFKDAALIFGRDVLGRLWDIKAAALLNCEDVRLWFLDDRFLVHWRGKVYEFEEAKLSLNAFERASGARSGCRTYKAKGFNTFLEQLKNGK